jgi:hypothetical protein
MAKSGGSGRPARQTQDTTKSTAKPRGTAMGRAVRSLPVIGDVVKELDRVQGDTTYSGPQKSKRIKGYGEQ